MSASALAPMAFRTSCARLKSHQHACCVTLRQYPSGTDSSPHYCHHKTTRFLSIVLLFLGDRKFSTRITLFQHAKMVSEPLGIAVPTVMTVPHEPLML